MTTRFAGALLCALSVALVLGVLPAAGAETVPLPDRNPKRPGAAAAEKPKPVPPGEAPSEPWTTAEIDAAKAICKELLTGEPLDYDALPPIKEGLCGTPAPVLLRAIGTDEKVTIDPPATMSCPMAHTLAEWLKSAVQPEAKKLFGSPVVKIRNATSYACRNRYGGAATPLSEHALANALDVSELTLADGTRITVLDDWPKPVVAEAEEEPKPESAAAKAETPEKAEPVKADKAKMAPAANSESKRPTLTPADRVEPGSTKAKTSRSVIGRAEAAPAPPPPPEAKAEAKPDPKAEANPAAKPDSKPDPKTEFVVYLHEQACQKFGTVLGPNANAAHKNHFHLEMKARRGKGFCE